MHYSIHDLVRLAKRENNSKRTYLYVNPLQGKHIPTAPEDTLEMCHELAEIVNNTYPTDSLFVIGFAETATGIAAAISSYLNNIDCYQNTTREIKEGEKYLYFTESHSHATDQMLLSEGLKEYLEKIDRVLFIDDEVTTGSTICKLIKTIKENYHVPDIEFSIVSILNSMTQSRKDTLKHEGIDCLYLLEMPFEYRKDSIMAIPYEDYRHTISFTCNEVNCKKLCFFSTINIRTVHQFEEYEKENEKFADLIQQELKNSHYHEILILGTEEFMYPALYVGSLLKKKGFADDVKMHATTRSPILAFGGDYPLFHRYQVRSMYDINRTTYIYNLKKYDKVIIITDAQSFSDENKDLISALIDLGNEDITLAQWKYLQ